MKLTALLVSLAASSLMLTACTKTDQGTASPNDTAAPPAAGATDEPGHEHAHEHDFPGAVDEYHSAMAPLWHAEVGEARTKDTCAAAGDLVAKAEAITTAEIPAGASDADAWRSNGLRLVEATKALQTVCKDDPAAFDRSFEAVHEAFHALVALVGHEEQG